ncbi:MAG: glycosyltransferase [Thermoplasmatales archaeon]
MNLDFFTFPYVPSLESGRGVDRICYYIKREILLDGYNFRIVDGSELSGKNTISKMISRGLNLYKFLNYKENSQYLAATPYSGAMLSLLKRKPLVTMIHDIVPFEMDNQIHYSFKSRIERLAVKNRYKVSIRNSDLVIVPFKYTKHKLIELFELDESKIEIVGYGIDINQSKEEILSTKSENETFKVLFIGGLNPIDRGGLVVPEIAKLLSLTGTDIQFIVSSKYESLKEIIERVNSLGVSHMFKFIDFIPESQLDMVMRSADLFLYPSLLGFSLLLMQALANGLPILVSRRLDNIEFASDFGYLVEDNSPETFANEILRIATDKAFRTSLIERSIDFIRDKSASDMAKKIIDVIMGM